MYSISATDKSSHYPGVTKRIKDIFRSSQKCILIEGAPGIGKTVLAEEIAYCWANGEILNDMKLFLLFVRDPDLHYVNSINKLVYYLSNHYLNDNEVMFIADELRWANGSNVVFVIDGYDECPCDKPLKGFIDKLCQSDILPQCMIVITSRPTASLLLRQFTTQRIEILGLAKKEQEQYISETLKGSSEMKMKLQEYLKQQPIINSLIYVPLHLAILLYLFKQDCLPETLTEMNELFIIHTIYRNLSKAQGALIYRVKKLTDLPEAVFNVIKQLSMLAFKGLLKNQLVFVEDEIKEVCPEVYNIPEAINGFGLLQTVQHYCKKGAAGTDMTFVFLHFTMQEFLAAFYMSALQSSEQSLWIKRTFWDSHFNFMWMMYVGIVGVKSECVTKLVQSFDVNCKYNIQYKTKECLHLFQCYLEAKDVKFNEMPNVLSTIFNDGYINFYGLTSLLPNHLTSLTYYMMKARVKWKSINLRACNIRDDGMRILQQFFINFKDKATSIKDICLSSNNLSSFFGSQTDVDQELQVETKTIVINTFYSFHSVNLSNNHICYNGIIELADVSLQKLNISHNNLSDNEARAINECLKKNTKIQELDVSDNAFNNEGVIAIFEAISVNTTLCKISIAGNNVSDYATEAIGSYLTINNTLLELNISKTIISKEGIMRIVKAYTKDRTLHKLVCTHNNLSKSGLQSINEFIKKHNAVQIFDASWNSIGSKSDHLAININFQQTDMTNNNKSLHTHCKEIWSLNEISFQNDSYKHQLLNCCLEDTGIIGVPKGNILPVIFDLISIDVLQHLDISCNNISDEGAKQLAVAIQVSKTLQELDISKNWISKEGVIRIVEACTINRTLHKLVCTHNNLSKSELAAINEYIRKVYVVLIFDASWNSISSKSGKLAIKTNFEPIIIDEVWLFDKISEKQHRMEFLHVCVKERRKGSILNLSSMEIYNFQLVLLNDYLKFNSEVNTLDLSRNKINNKGIEKIIEVIQVNSKLQCLSISHNKLSDNGALIMSDCLKVNVTLCKLNLSNNNITDKGLKSLAEAIQMNTKLLELNVSKNWISKEGVMRIVEACTINRTLHELVCTHNNLSKSGLGAINEYIRKENAVQIFKASWNTITTKDGQLAIKTIFQLLDMHKTAFQHKLQSYNDNNVSQEELCFADEIDELKYRREFLQTCIEEIQYLNVQNVNLSDRAQICIISDGLNLNKNIIKLNLCSCQLSNEGIKLLVQAVEVSTTLQNLNISSNAMTYDGVLSISNFLKINSTLCELNLSDNKIGDEATRKLSEAIEMNKALRELNVSKSWISKEGVMRIVEACAKNRALHTLVCTHNKLSKPGLAAISEYIRKENAVQIFKASWNTITTKDGQLAIKTIFQLLDMRKAAFQLSGQQKLQSYNDNNASREELWFADEEFLQSCVEEIQYLNVQFLNLLGMTQIGMISNGLKFNRNVIEVSLCNCQINNEGVKVLLQAVEASATLQNLDISNNAISNVGILYISDFLKINYTLCKLNLSGNVIKDEGTEKLSEAIQVNTILQNLNISRNMITDEGAKRLAEAIQVNKTLQELNFSKNLISKEGVIRMMEACIISRTLHRLVCTHNNLSKSGLAAINEYIRKENAVQIFDASWNTIVTKNYRLTIKTTFQLSGMQQGLQSGNDKAFREELWFADEIEELKYRREFLQTCVEEIRHLNVRNVNLSDRAQICIISDGLNLNKNIIELNLCSCQLSNEGIKLLVQAVEVSTTLQNLNISSNAMSYDGVLSISNFLKINSTLSELNLSDNIIEDEATRKLSEAIRVNTTLQNLNISENMITDEGTKKLAEAIEMNKALRELNVSKNWVSKEGVMRIVEACTKNRTLHTLVCTHNNLSKPGLAAISEYIRKENAVQIFKASWNTITTKDGQLAIKTIFQLLDMHKTAFHLSGQEKIQSYNDDNVSQEELWFADEEFLQSCVEEIRHLNIQNVNLLDRAQICIISDGLNLNKNIIELNLCSCQLSNEGIELLVQAVEVSTTLQNLNISSNAMSYDGILSISNFLKINSTLCELNLSDNIIEDEATRKLSEAIQVNTALQNLNISENIITDEGTKKLAEAIEMNKALRELNVSKNLVSKEGVMRIVEACTKNRTLHTLVCTHNNLSKSGLAAISEYIRKENAVQIFKASWNTITTKDDQLAIKTIFQLLDMRKAAFQLSGQQKLQSYNDNNASQEELWFADEEFLQFCVEEIQYLNVQLLNLSDMTQIGMISNGLKFNRNVIEVSLCNCQINNEGVKVLLQAVEASATLQNLDISNNAISNVGVLYISDFLKINYTLCKLNLSGNVIKDEGTEKLSEAIQVNTTLQNLNISRNIITDEGAKRLAEAIQVKNTLQELNISKNLVSKEGVMRIVEACAKYRTLHTLVCTYNKLSKPGLAAISEYIRKENAVQIFKASWNTITTKDGQLAIKTIFQLLDMHKTAFQHKLQSYNDNNVSQEELCFADEIDELKYRREFLQTCIEEIQYLNVQNVNLSDRAQICIISDGLNFNKNIIELNLCSCQLSNEGIELLVQAVEVSTTLQNLNISSNAMSYDGILSISNFLKINSTLCELNLSDNIIEDEATRKLSEAIQVNTTLQNLNISENIITDEGTKKLAEAIEMNKALRELNLSKNLVSKEGVMRIVEACTKNRTLHTLVCTHNNLSKSGLAAISEYIRKENAVQIFKASWNTITTKDDQLAIKTIFQLLDMRKAAFQLSGQQKLQSYNDNNASQEELWFADEEFLQFCVEEIQYLNVQLLNLSDMTQIGMISNGLKFNRNVIEVSLCNCQINNEGVKVLLQAVEASATLQNLDISNNAISNVGVLYISDFLKINYTLCKLNLSGNVIKDEGTEKLSEAIQVNTTLQNLNISRNIITDEGAKRLAEAIQVKNTLQELNISKNLVSKEGVMRIVEACAKYRTLHTLVCTYNKLSKPGLAAISEYIRKENAVQIFKASWNTIATKDGQLAIKTIFQLLDMHKTAFQLSGQQKLQSYNDDNVSQEEFWFADEEFLQSCIEEIQYLNVQFLNLSDMTQIGIISNGLKFNRNVIEVSLCNCQINNEGVKVLLQAVEASATLQNLDISINAIFNVGVLYISDFLNINNTLCKLNLSGNVIKDEGTEKLSEAIQVNTTLQNLNISRNIITDEGAKKLAEAIQVNKTLQELNISKNLISKEGVMRIVEACTINRTLHKLVCTHNNLSKSGLAAINEYIRKENAVQICDASWSNSVVSASGWGSLFISTPQSLKWSPDGWETISFDYHKQVYVINDAVWNDNIQYDFTGDSLTELNFSSHVIPSKIWVDIMQETMQIATIQKLNIPSNGISDDEAVIFSECLKTNTTLIELDMSGRGNITSKGTNAIAEALKVNNTLQKLNISYNISFTDGADGAIAFSECLKTNTVLIELDISWNNIRHEGAIAIAEALKVNNTLQKLKISWDKIGDNGAIIFSECLKANTTLIELDLSENFFTLMGGKAIAEALKVNNTLQKLNISCNKIGDDGTIVFSECLETNTTLIELDLSENYFTLMGAKAIADALKVNNTLQKLNISYNKPRVNVFGEIFSKCLKTNTTLIELVMSGNCIRCKGASAIAEALKVNNTLQKLNISYNEILNEGAIAFTECLKSNATLIELNMSKNYIDYRILQSITQTIKANQKYKVLTATC